MGAATRSTFIRVDGRMWLLMIVLHAAAALGAFAVGVAVIDPRRAGSHRWTLPALVGLLVAVTVFMIGAMAAHWSDLPGASRIAFGALVGLAVYMVYRARHASGLADHDDHARAARHVDDLGFILIALFDGFVIVAAIDLGAPAWLLTPLALLAVLVATGQYNDTRAGSPPHRPPSRLREGRKGTGAKEDQPSWIVDAGMRRPARSTSRTPPTVATAEWGVAGCAIIEAASVLGLFPGGVEHPPRALLDAGLADAVAAPRALLDAGLADAVAAGHVGVVTPPPYDPGRDAATGLLNPRGLRDYAHVLADATGAVLDVGDLPLVLGGDCSILRQPLGITAARASWAVVHRRPRRPDFYQPDAESDGRLWHSKG
jgi:hypothetical protein